MNKPLGMSQLYQHLLKKIIVFQKVAPGCDGLIMIPHLQGSGPPDTNNIQKGVYFGITLAHQKAILPVRSWRVSQWFSEE